MRLRAFSFAMLVAILGGSLGETLLPLLADAHTCGCPIKGPCCKTSCPLRSAGRSMRSCGDATSRAASPAPSPWATLVDIRATPSADRVVSTLVAARNAVPLSGVDRIPEQPPRFSFLA
jgi:hypothetical protein